MDFLSKEQIPFEIVSANSDQKDSFKLGFISKRLHKLITCKMYKKEWRVFQIPINSILCFPGFLPYPKYQAVLTSPTKKSVLAIRKE